MALQPCIVQTNSGQIQVFLPETIGVPTIFAEMVTFSGGTNPSTISANQSIALTGAVTGSGTTSVSTTFGAISSHLILANASGVAAAPIPTALTAGSGVTLTFTTGLITISAAGSGGTVTSLTAGTGLIATPTTITQTGSFAISNTGITAASYQGITFNAQGQATTAVNAGYLTGNQTITLSSDATGSGTTAITVTLATVNANTGVFQGLTLNAKGLVTAATNQNYLTGNQTITLAGYASGSGTTAITVTNIKVKGITDGSSAAAGDVGELISAKVTSGAALALSSNVITVVTSVPLTAGDWDVYGDTALAMSGSPAIVSMAGWVSASSTASPVIDSFPFEWGSAVTGLNGEFTILPHGPLQQNATGTSTIYLLAQVSFTGAGAGVSAFGEIRARRMR
jgi:hypothetical protein